jgi:hypothetical protein
MGTRLASLTISEGIMSNLQHETVRDLLIIYLDDKTQKCRIIEWVSGPTELPFIDEIIYPSNFGKYPFEVIAIKDREWWHEVYVRIANERVKVTD